MASDFTRRPSPLGVPTIVELPDSTATYPHRITQIASRFFQRTCIDVRIGPPDAGISHPTHGDFVQHPEPFDADGTLSMACRSLLLKGVREGVKCCGFRMCIVWAPASCSYVETDGTICETAGGEALPAGIAFEAARLAVIRDKYPQINVEGPSGITRAGCPAHATKDELVAQAVGIVMRTGRRARVVWSESETIDATPGKTICDTKLGMKYPHIVVYGRKEFVLFYPDAMTKEELIAKAAEIVARWCPRVCVVWSSTESIWPRPPQQEVIW